MLSLLSLSVERAGKPILHKVSLDLQPGKTALLMGPNGSGKSSLALTLLGHSNCTVTAGSITFNGKDLFSLPVHERARAGIFLVTQSPHELPGVSVATFLREAYTGLTGKPADHLFHSQVKGYLERVGLNDFFLTRSVHHGFSGGEKKRFELLQLLLFKPRIALLDEIDSGLDLQGIATIGSLLQDIKKECPQTAFLIITHNTQLLDAQTVDSVHIMLDGKIIQSGGPELIDLIRTQGYHGLSSL